MSKDEMVLYLCPNAPHFKMRLQISESDPSHKVQAHNGVLRLTPAQAAILDALMKRPDRGDLRTLLRKVDVEAAEKAALEHKASKGPAAVSGPFTSQDLASKKLQDARKAQDQRFMTNKQGGENTKVEPTPMKVPRGKGPLDVKELDISQVNPIPPPAALSRINRG